MKTKIFCFLIIPSIIIFRYDTKPHTFKYTAIYIWYKLNMKLSIYSFFRMKFIKMNQQQSKLDTFDCE